VTSTWEWLDRLKSRHLPESTWAERRRHEALELLANARGGGSWIELSTHYNGFVREVAVRELSRLSSPEALVALIERLNDWVPQIRELALAAMNRYLTPAQAPALLFALPSLMALAARHRGDHGPTLLAARAVLQSAQIRDEVLAHFRGRQGKTARYLFALLLEQGVDTQSLLRLALAHRELTVRLAAVAACEDLPAADAAPLLHEALARPGAKVRVCVLRALLSRVEDPAPLLRDALLDASPAIRNLARWAAPRHDVDALAVLAERLRRDMPGGKRPWLGILGLAAELDVSLDMPWLNEALRCDYPSVRQAAVRLLGDEHLDELLQALGDPSDKVFQVALGLLHKLPWLALNAGVRARLDGHWHDLPTSRRAAILNLMSSWQQIAYLLQRLDAEPVAEALWLRQIEGWCQRQYQIVDPVTPKDERAALQQRLKDLAAAGRIHSPRLALFAG